jgi:hypothetical protein
MHQLMKRLSAVCSEYAFLLIIPILILVLAFSLRLATGPFWLATNSDPSYLYLENGLYWLKGVAPYFTDHPGTPLEVLFLGLAVLFNIGKTPAGMIDAVLLRPEFYLGVAYVLLMILFFLSLTFVGVYTYQKTRSRALALLMQLPAFFYLMIKAMPVLPVIANINAEPLLISVINLYAALVIKLFYARDDQEERWTTFALAFICGLALSVKFTAGTLWLIPFALLPGRRRWIFLLGALASFVVWTLPIITRYADMMKWVVGLFTRVGSHTSGKAGLVDFGIYIPALTRLISDRPVYFLTALMLGVAALLFWHIRRSKDKAVRFLLVIAGAAVFHYFLVARQPATHYMTPGFGLSGLLFFFAFLSWRLDHARREKAVLVFVVLVAFFEMFQALAYRQTAARFTREVLAFQERIHKEFAACQVIPYYRATGQEYALQFGDNIYLTRLLGEELNRLYPGRFSFEPFNYQVHSYTKLVRVSQLAQIKPCVLFQGPLYDFSIGPYVTEKIADGPGEYLYQLKSSDEDEAIKYYLMAQVLEEKGRLPEAYLLALHSRELKFQPSALVDGLIDRLKKKLEQGK